MTVRELYHYITTHMTAEQALMKLLEGSLRQYEGLKFDPSDASVHPILIITTAALDLGWDISIPASDGEDIIGLIVGTNEYILQVLESKS